MRYCEALNCKNTSKGGFKMSHFPASPTRRKKWIEAVDREGWNPKKYSTLCDVHFSEDMWENEKYVGKKKLKPNAIPNIFYGPVAAISTKDARAHSKVKTSQNSKKYTQRDMNAKGTANFPNSNCGSDEIRKEYEKSLNFCVKIEESELIKLNRKEGLFEATDAKYIDSDLNIQAGEEYDINKELFIVDIKQEPDDKTYAEKRQDILEVAPFCIGNTTSMFKRTDAFIVSSDEIKEEIHILDFEQHAGELKYSLNSGKTCVKIENKKSQKIKLEIYETNNKTTDSKTIILPSIADV